MGKCMLWKERAGWVIVVLIHVWCVFFMSQFVRHYSDALIEQFISSTLTCALYRFILAPTIRGIVILPLLLIARVGSACDGCIMHLPGSIIEFPFVASDWQGPSSDGKGGED